MSEESAVLLKLVTGGEKDHVRILCADGEVKINTFILGALAALLKDIVKLSSPGPKPLAPKPKNLKGAWG